MKGEKTGGRTKGTPNRLSLSLRQCVLETFEHLGGVRHMVAWAKKNPGDFYRIAARLVPPGSPVNLGPLTGAIVEQGKAVLGKMSEGAISPEQANSVMGAIVAQARVVESEELERRIKALEERQHGKP